jgi:hypothetical protein
MKCIEVSNQSFRNALRRCGYQSGSGQNANSKKKIAKYLLIFTPQLPGVRRFDVRQGNVVAIV